MKLPQNNNHEVKTSDLNGVDYLNGRGTISKKGELPPTQEDGTTLKGALSNYNGVFSTYQEQQWISNFINDLFSLQAMNFKFNGLPSELDITRIERKPFDSGSSAWVKIAGKIYVVNYTIKEFNLYNEPTHIAVNEPKAENINGMEFVIGKDCEIYRNTLSSMSVFDKVYRYINTLEKILFQIEKNLLTSAPKGILNIKQNKLESAFATEGENSVKKSFEVMINGEDTFYMLKRGDGYDPLDADNEMWTPIELTDRTDTLIKNYTLMKEQIKETMGESPNIHQKKERTITDEVDQQKGLSEKVLRGMFEVRKIDLEKINKTFGTNISIELLQDEIEEPMEEEGGEDE